jgi:hypothetical protein
MIPARSAIHSQKWRVQRAQGLSSIQEGHTGTVTVVQRVDSSLRLNVRLYLLASDGV